MPHHFEHQQDRQGNSTFMLGLMAGTAIGAGVALLMAPREGAQMRRELSNGAHRLGEQLSHGAESVRRTARRAADTATDLIERGRSAYHDASATTRETMDEGTSRLDAAVDSAATSARQTASRTAANVERATQGV
jgi:gas vesicle protein